MLSSSGGDVATYEMTGPSSINEGSAGTYTVNTTGVDDGTQLYYAITLRSSDFVASTRSGTITINNNTAQFSVTPIADNTTEGNETYTITLYGDQAQTQTKTSIGGIINDTSQDPPAEFRFAYHMYGNSNMGDLYLYWVVGSTATKLFEVSGVQHSSATEDWSTHTEYLSNYDGQTGRMAFVYDGPGGYRGDCAIDNIFYETSSGSTFDYSGTSGSQRNKWDRTSGNYSTPSAAALASANFSINSNANQNGQWSWESDGGTPSSGTGPNGSADGTGGEDYIYFEASGATNTNHALKMASSIYIS